MKKTLSIIVFLIVVFNITKSQTVGLTKYGSTTLDYVLFSPNADTSTFLIDRCGELVNEWTSDYNPGMAFYLTSSGDLMRCAKTNNTFFGNAAGRGGLIEVYDWNNNLIWDYQISNTTEMQHHDIELLPNGNFLVIVWDKKTMIEADSAGRDTTTVPSDFWSEKIVEIQPNYTNNTGLVVWEWYLWDHLIQDFDNTKNNYGVVSDFPQLVDVNFPVTSQPKADWVHINGIDYNETLDQIILSCHSFNEFWVIDHSTTTVEAAGHTGGNSGMGGDILYRWGNPLAYQRGTVADQKLFKQHDARWIEDTLVGAGKIMVFNNQVGVGDPGGDYSAVNIIDPPVDGSGNYSSSVGQPFAPLTYDWTYEANPKNSFFSTNISGAARIENGNTLICEGRGGRFFEIDQNDTIVWEYVNPKSNSGMLSQGDTPTNNYVFRCVPYSADFSGFMGKNLTSNGPLELNPTQSICVATGIEGIANNSNINIYPNPAKDLVIIETEELFDQVVVRNSLGQSIMTVKLDLIREQLPTNTLHEGLYFFEFSNKKRKEIKRVIIVQ